MTFIWGFLSGTACAWAVFVAVVVYIIQIPEQDVREQVQANHKRVEDMLQDIPYPVADASKEDSPSRGTSARESPVG